MSVQSKRAASTARTWLGCGLVIAGASLAGCSSQTVDQPVSAAVESPAPAEQSKETSGPALENFDASNYDRSTQIDNPWMPLKPGTRYTYQRHHRRG